ncbi:MAG: nitrogen regulation protein NR(I) [Alphaproteobacteria bacterium]|nr:nitrogen regulation protein NR(I) [Alphaproteobacteria bacterium]
MSGEVILVADDDRAIRTVIDHALARAGYTVRSTGTAAGLWQWIAAGEGDLVITDVVMPDRDGLDLLPRIRALRPELPVIVMSARNTFQTAVRAAEGGAYDYLPKPFGINLLTGTVAAALARSATPAGAAGPSGAGAEALPFIGRSPAMQDVYRQVARLLATDLTVLIIGESGTGKELVARALHDFGARRQGPFVAMNMAALPRELIESELFGHERGAFTGAVARAVGRFGQAESGTLFLDEIGDMPVEAQTRLLRVLQEGSYTAVGGQTPLRANARVIAATHRDLRDLIARGLFREDLFHRLNVVPIRVPPLRERPSDIPELVQHFSARGVAQGLPAKRLDAAALERLAAHTWPGNVRELENLIYRLTVLCAEETIGVGAIDAALGETTTAARQGGEAAGLGAVVEGHLRRYFSTHGGSLPPAGLYGVVLREVERPLIVLTLAATNGNQLRAARLLGLNRNTLRKKIRELGIAVMRSQG